MPSFVEIGPPVPEKKIFEGVLPYVDMAVILVMTPGLFTKTLVPPSYRCFISNLALIGQAVSEKIFKYYGDINVYYPRVGAVQTCGPMLFFQNHISSVHLPISFKFFPSIDMFTICTIQMHCRSKLTLS